mmetsp:Transcript_6872/g.17321  ORF Transcript_6872/g.17321 Transcript_6872/m.17321 type:complete len:194 (-) Transcript_6872:2106-2687(-)
MKEFLKKLREKVYIGSVGGSDFSKAQEQLGDDILDMLDFCFPENGLVAFKDGKPYGEPMSLKKHLGEEKVKELVNFCLRYVADLDIPIKRGTFVEFRNGMINVSPIGRNCSQEERNEFAVYNKEHKVLEKFVKALEDAFPHLNLKFSIGGQISFDVFPMGWDKTFCLQHVQKEGFKTIHFCGDKTYEVRWVCV